MQRLPTSDRRQAQGDAQSRRAPASEELPDPRHLVPNR